MNAWDRSCFFFSSRRRHTRSDRDWSSDVCSSDLHADIAADIDAVPARAARRGNDRRSAQERIAEIGRLRVKHRSDDRDTAKQPTQQDRKSTRLNSSHDQISYAVFCLKKKKKLEIPVHLRVRITHVTALWNQSNLLLHPAHCDTCRLALLEARLASNPVVATSTTAITA